MHSILAVETWQSVISGIGFGVFILLWIYGGDIIDMMKSRKQKPKRPARDNKPDSFCESCGAERKPNHKFCAKCGNPHA